MFHQEKYEGKDNIQFYARSARTSRTIVRLILGGELIEYTEMMGSARSTATERLTAKAAEMGADAIINVRYITTSVVGSAAELLVYGTAVKLS